LKNRIIEMKKRKILIITIAFISAICFHVNAQTVNNDTTKSLNFIIPDTNKVFNKEPLFDVVEDMPSFVGGEEAMYDWLGNNTKYPREAKEKEIEGTVIVQFIIEKDGSLSGISISKDIGGGCGDEALRVIKAMPKWIPGKQKGKVVRVQYALPFIFSLGKTK